MRDFFACYLLQSKSERTKGRTYIGFTVNPRRRIRQHNGEICSGAWKTRGGRPWDMVLVVYGFPTKVQALQFEWAWQNPLKSKATRDEAATLKGRGKRAGLQGAQGKVRLLMLMLGSAQWRLFPLSVRLLSSDHAGLLVGMPQPPSHIPVTIAPIEDLPVVVDDDFDEGPPAEAGSGSEEGPTGFAAAAEGGAAAAATEAAGGGAAAAECACCGLPAKERWIGCACGARTHLECLAEHFMQAAVPTRGSCPACGAASTWVEALSRETSVGWAQSRRRGRQRAALKADPEAKAAAKAAPADGQLGGGGSSDAAASPAGAGAGRGRGRTRAGRGRGRAIRAAGAAAAPDQAAEAALGAAADVAGAGGRRLRSPAQGAGRGARGGRGRSRGRAAGAGAASAAGPGMQRGSFSSLAGPGDEAGGSLAQRGEEPAEALPVSDDWCYSPPGSSHAAGHEPGSPGAAAAAALLPAEDVWCYQGSPPEPPASPGALSCSSCEARPGPASLGGSCAGLRGAAGRVFAGRGSQEASSSCLGRGGGSRAQSAAAPREEPVSLLSSSSESEGGAGAAVAAEGGVRHLASAAGDRAHKRGRSARKVGVPPAKIPRVARPGPAAASAAAAPSGSTPLARGLDSKLHLGACFQGGCSVDSPLAAPSPAAQGRRLLYDHHAADEPQVEQLDDSSPAAVIVIE